MLKTSKRSIVVCSSCIDSSMRKLADAVIRAGKHDRCLCIDDRDEEAAARSLIMLLNGKLNKLRTPEFL